MNGNAEHHLGLHSGSVHARQRHRLRRRHRHRRSSSDPFYKVYPELWGKIGNYSAWAWGISRLIDGIIQVKDQLKRRSDQDRRAGLLLRRKDGALWWGARRAGRAHGRGGVGRRRNHLLENVAGLHDPHGHQRREDRQHQLRLVHVQHEERWTPTACPTITTSSSRWSRPAPSSRWGTRSTSGWVMSPATSRSWPPPRSSRPWASRTTSATTSPATTRHCSAADVSDQQRQDLRRSVPQGGNRRHERRHQAQLERSSIWTTAGVIDWTTPTLQ